MKRTYPGDKSYTHELQLRQHLAGCGCMSDKHETIIAKLSGGQRSRIAFALVSYTQPHVLLMDEPTNDLDLETAGALAECVAGFEGGVVIVSHDSHFVEKVATEVWHVGPPPGSEGVGKVERLESFAAYKKKAVSNLERRMAKAKQMDW